MGLYDLTLKKLLLDAPEDLVEAALGGGFELGAALPTELALKERRIDHLRRIRKGSMEALLLIEVKTEPKPGLTRQLFGYFAQVVQAQEELPVLPLLILLRPGDSVGLQTPWKMEALGFEACSFQFKTLRVHELDAKGALEAGKTGLLPLIPLMRGASAELVREANHRLENSGLEEQNRIDLQAVLGLLAAAELDLPEIALMIPKEVYMKSGLYESFVEEGRMAGLLEGRQKGHQEGRQEGRQEALRQSILKFVSRKWPELLARAEVLVADAQPAVLENLFEALLDAAGPGEAEAALRNGQPRG